MKLLPGIDLKDLDYDLNKSQAMIISLLAYFSIITYTFLLLFECHNVYFYLYRQKKYKAYPVTLFYAFARLLIKIFKCHEWVFNRTIPISSSL